MAFCLEGLVTADRSYFCDITFALDGSLADRDYGASRRRLRAGTLVMRTHKRRTVFSSGHIAYCLGEIIDRRWIKWMISNLRGVVRLSQEMASLQAHAKPTPL